MDGVADEILAYYEKGREQARLATTSRLEFLRTCELLERFLPAPPSRVLDVGGGAGAYALHLQARGHPVGLVDPVPLHVEQARAAGVHVASVGDARALAVADASFDAVLLLGPLYHLLERDDRLAALREAYRVVRPGGVVAAAAISRFASTQDGLVRGFLREPGFEQIVADDVATGEHRNPTDEPRWFTSAYFHLPDHLGTEVADAGWELDAVLAVEGPASMLTDTDAWLDDRISRAALLRAIARVEREPSLLGASSHLLAVAHR